MAGVLLMATRSLIVVRKDDGKWHTIYCHYDGYPSHNGRMLLTYYNDQQKADALVALGDLSYLDKSIECPEGHTFDHPVEGFTTAYMRDRGSTMYEAGARKYVSMQGAINTARHNDAEYVYVFTDGHWLVGKTRSKITDYQLLSEVVEPLETTS